MIKTILVGSHFVPPAKEILRCLAAETTVMLVGEPENPYDSNAIKVFVDEGEVDWESVNEETLAGMGHSIDSLQNGKLICLGHVASSNGKPLLKARGVIPGVVGTKEILDLWSGELEDAPATINFVGELFVITIGED